MGRSCLPIVSKVPYPSLFILGWTGSMENYETCMTKLWYCFNIFGGLQDGSADNGLPVNLSSWVPGPLVVNVRTESQSLSSDLHTCTVRTHAYTLTQEHKKKHINK